MLEVVIVVKRDCMSVLKVSALEGEELGGLELLGILEVLDAGLVPFAKETLDGFPAGIFVAFAATGAGC